jgi:two-component system sensor histidine kinase DesK
MTNVIGDDGRRHLPAGGRRRDGEGMPALAYPLELRSRAPSSVPVPILVTRPGLAWGVVGVVGVVQRERSVVPVLFATPAALAYGCVFPLLQLALVAKYPAGDGDVRWALLATACYLPLHLHHVYWAVRGVRPPAGRWTLAALALVVAAAVPAAGPNWLPVFAVVVVSALLVLPWPWSLVVAAGVTLAQSPLAFAVDSPIPDPATYYVFAVWWRATALFVPMWLLGSIRRLEAARRSLADEAVVRERLRIDGELRRTVGAALDSIAARGERAAALTAPGRPGEDPGPGAGEGALSAEVRALAEGSRRALADARQLVNGYRRPSLAAELESAVSLLAAAGIDTRIRVPDGGLPPDAGPAARSALRVATADVLHDDAASSCVIDVRYDDGGQVRVDVSTDAGSASGSGSRPAGTAS